MDTLSTVLRYEMLFLLTSLIGLIAYQMLTNRINMKGLLLDKASGRAFSPGRFQLLVVTLGIAIYYLLMVFKIKETGRLPDLPNEFLMVLGGSHVFYLGGKVYGLIASKLELAATRFLGGPTKQ